MMILHSIVRYPSVAHALRAGKIIPLGLKSDDFLNHRVYLDVLQQAEYCSFCGRRCVYPEEISQHARGEQLCLMCELRRYPPRLEIPF